MPESVTDRPTKAHSYVFLLTKRARYFYDADAVREGYAGIGKYGGSAGNKSGANGDRNDAGRSNVMLDSAGRNARSVWTINTRPFAGAHFAVMPEELPRRCILAGTSEAGVCRDCGAPWTRIVERTGMPDPEYQGDDLDPLRKSNNDADRRRSMSGAKYAAFKAENPDRLLGWRLACDHDAPTEPALVLDPFFGSGTTGKVAHDLGRSYVGVELNPDYAEVQRLRFGGKGYAQRKALEDAGQLGLFADA